jgi:hypothetical protein
MCVCVCVFLLLFSFLKFVPCTVKGTLEWAFSVFFFYYSNKKKCGVLRCLQPHDCRVDSSACLCVYFAFFFF